MDKFLVVLVGLMTTSSAGRLRRQYPNNNLQPYNQPPINIPGPFRPYHDQTNGQEPANYDFRYDVNAPEYGTLFGHQEQRQGDVARGRYYVLLPDGRTQVVEYTADQDGYHPTISYQGGSGGGGYGQGGHNQGGNSQGGYNQGGYNQGGYSQGGGVPQGGFRGNRPY